MNHGLRSTYVNHKCRCGPCRAANAAYGKGYTTTQKLRLLQEAVAEVLAEAIDHGEVHDRLKTALEQTR